MYNCNRYSWSGHNEIIHKSENPLVDIESLFFIIGGNQGIESYMDIIHNFSKQEENFVEKAYLASNKIEEKLDDLFFETLKLKKKKLSLEEIEDKIQECIS